MIRKTEKINVQIYHYNSLINNFLRIHRSSFIIHRFLVLAILIVVSVFQLRGQDSRVAEIDQLVTYCQANGMFNGNILVAEKGEIIYHKSMGIADFDTDKPLEL